MIVFPNAKINLGLHIAGKRDDGFHDIETTFYPIAIQDVVEITRGEAFTLSLSGAPLGGTIEDNLCTKAYGLLKKDFPGMPPVHIFLHKAIPTGAGLGGGSADGSFSLVLLNTLFRLGLATAALTRYAMQLGSDC